MSEALEKFEWELNHKFEMRLRLDYLNLHDINARGCLQKIFLSIQPKHLAGHLDIQETGKEKKQNL